MDIGSYLRILRARWRLVAILTLAGLAAAAAVAYTTPATYQASTQVFVSTPQSGESTADLLSGNTFSQDRVQSYAKIATSRLVLQPVVQKLGLSISAQELAAKVSASAPLNTVLINLSVEDANAAEAARLANAVAAQFSIAVAGLEAPAAGGAAAVRVSMTQPALVPAVPVSPKKKLDLVLGFLVGLLAGVGLAVLRDVLDTTIRQEADLKQVTDSPVIGGIAFDPDAAARPLVVQTSPESSRAEAFRQFRTNLQFTDVAGRPRSIVVTSSIPGEGKSTTTANLALTLAAAGASIVLVEGDLRRPRITDYLGLDNGAGLTNVLIGQAAIDEVLQPWGVGNLQVIGSGPKPPNPSELLGSAAMQKVLGELTERFEYVLVDAPPLLPFTDAAVLSKFCGATVLIVASGRAKTDQLRRSVESLSSVGANLVGIVVNFMPVRASQAYGYSYGYHYAESYAKKRRGEKTPAVAAQSNGTPHPVAEDPEWADLAGRHKAPIQPGTPLPVPDPLGSPVPVDSDNFADR